jgi:hypothetical protein
MCSLVISTLMTSAVDNTVFHDESLEFVENSNKSDVAKHEQDPSKSFSDNDIRGSELIVNTVNIRKGYLTVIVMDL